MSVESSGKRTLKQAFILQTALLQAALTYPPTAASKAESIVTFCERPRSAASERATQ